MHSCFSLHHYLHPCSPGDEQRQISRIWNRQEGRKAASNEVRAELVRFLDSKNKVAADMLRLPMYLLPKLQKFPSESFPNA
jgi:hypothetical protein